MLPSFVETLSSIPLRKQVWKTKAKKKKTKNKTTKTKYLSLSATNMVFASLFLIIIVFKNQLLLEENYWWWFILETTLKVSGTFFYTYITTSIVTWSFSCIISQIHTTLGQALLSCPFGHKENYEVAETVDYTNLFVLSLHKLHQKMSFTYGNHARNSPQLGLSMFWAIYKKGHLPRLIPPSHKAPGCQ